MADRNAVKTRFTDLLLAGSQEETVAWVQAVIDEGMPALDSFNHIFTPAMAEVGARFGRLDIFLPELVEAAEKAKAVSDQVLKPAVASNAGQASTVRGKVVLASVQGDLHDIGKNMVSLMLQVHGFQVEDMGVNVPPRTVLARAEEVGADIVALSALMTTSMPYMKEVVQLRDGLGLKARFAIIVGGAPITPEYSAQIGADAFGLDAVDGTQKCIQLMAKRQAAGV